MSNMAGTYLSMFALKGEIFLYFNILIIPLLSFLILYYFFILLALKKADEKHNS